MKKTVLKFGLMSGGMSAAILLCTAPLIIAHSHWADLFGYTGIVLSFLLVFFGIRSFREGNGGTVTFGRAVAVGVLIALISTAFYIATWETLYFGWPGFANEFEQCMIERVRETAGANADAQVAQIQQFLVLYRTPWKNVGMVFLEPFPVGVVMSLLAGFLLRTKRRA